MLLFLNPILTEQSEHFLGCLLFILLSFILVFIRYLLSLPFLPHANEVWGKVHLCAILFMGGRGGVASKGASLHLRRGLLLWEGLPPGWSASKGAASGRRGGGVWVASRGGGLHPVVGGLHPVVGRLHPVGISIQWESASRKGLHPGEFASWGGLYPAGIGQTPPPLWILDTTEYGQRAGSTRPTGMHSCYFNMNSFGLLH